MTGGTIIGGRFELLQLAGRGGMAEVWRARDQQSGETVAVKMLPKNTPHLMRFRREIDLLAQLSDRLHPGIVRHVAHGETDTGMFLAMEWLDGQPLSRRQQERGLSVAEGARIVQAVAEALAAAHAEGVVHRDVKPSNILILDEEATRIKVIDFGVARRVVEPLGLTSTGVLVGSPGYMAPEQARALRDVGPRADTFALGCVLYECLTGRAAFAGEHLMAVLAKIILAEPTPARRLCPELPAPLEDLLWWMLAKEPAERLDCADVAVKLRELIANADALGGFPDALRRRKTAPELPTEITPPADPSSDAVACLILVGSLGDEEGDDERVAAQHADLERALIKFGASLESLADGSALIKISVRSGRPDEVARAARCAASVRLLLPEAAIVVTSQRSAQVALDHQIDYGVRDLATEMVHNLFDAQESSRRPLGSVALDDPSAQLLAAALDVRHDSAGHYFVAGAE